MDIVQSLSLNCTQHECDWKLIRWTSSDLVTSFTVPWKMFLYHWGELNFYGFSDLLGSTKSDHSSEKFQFLIETFCQKVEIQIKFQIKQFLRFNRRPWKFVCHNSIIFYLSRITVDQWVCEWLDPKTDKEANWSDYIQIHTFVLSCVKSYSKTHVKAKKRKMETHSTQTVIIDSCLHFDLIGTQVMYLKID